MTQTLTVQRLRLLAQKRWLEDRLPFLTAVLVGLAAHGYAFSNKLVNHDEIESIFGKGATITSGRWGLELIKIVFPDWSMPWIYGLLSLLLMAASACLMLRFLELRSKPLQAVLAALVISFPSLTGNFCFMFTSAPYAWSFFLTVLAVSLFSPGSRLRVALSIVLLVLALGIYQAYISVAASLFVVRLIGEALDGKKPFGRLVLDAARALLLLVSAILVYYCVTLLVFRFTGAEFNSYVTENVNDSVSLPRRVRMAYDAFVYIFSFRNFYVISSEAARYLHLILLGLLLCGLGVLTLRAGKPLHTALLCVLLCLLPLSICCMFLIMSAESIHTLVMYSFVCLYFLMGMTAERLGGLRSASFGSLLAFPLTAIVLGNVYFSNMCYLKLQLQYDNAYAFYTVLAAQVQGAEGFDEGCRLALVGRQENLLHSFPEMDTDLFQAVSPDLINAYSRDSFVHRYLGFDIPFAEEAELERLADDPRLAEMAVYPYYGSVRRIDDCMVVRLG